MRKFNLKGKVAQKLKGLDTAETVNKPADANGAEKTQRAESRVPTHGRLCYVWRTDVGRLRKNNQDAVIIGNGLFGVADGMGGHNGGEIASAGLRDGLLRETEGKNPEAGLLEEAVKKVNHEIWEQQENDASLSGMGTTLTVLWAAEKEMIIGQVGDSRAYLIRDGVMQQVTADHSMVADMVRRGVLTEEQAACHPMRNYITRAVGTDETVDADMTGMPRKNGDRWIICSDGLYGQISKQELQEAATAPGGLEKAADTLLQLALDRGGRDNISFILLQDEVEEEAENEESGNEQPKTGEGENRMPEKDDQEGETEQ